MRTDTFACLKRMLPIFSKKERKDTSYKTDVDWLENLEISDTAGLCKIFNVESTI